MEDAVDVIYNVTLCVSPIYFIIYFIIDNRQFADATAIGYSIGPLVFKYLRYPPLVAALPLIYSVEIIGKLRYVALWRT